MKKREFTLTTEQIEDEARKRSAHRLRQILLVIRDVEADSVASLLSGNSGCASILAVTHALYMEAVREVEFESEKPDGREYVLDGDGSDFNPPGMPRMGRIPRIPR